MITLPPFQRNYDNPDPAKSWFRMVDIRFKLHDITDDKMKAAIALATIAENSDVFNVVESAMHPRSILKIDEDSYKSLKETMVKLYDSNDPLFIKRYKALQIEWQGPEEEPVPWLVARIQRAAADIDLESFKINDLSLLLLVMSMRNPEHDHFRERALEYILKHDDATLFEVQQILNNYWMTRKEQKLFERPSPETEFVRIKNKNKPCLSCGYDNHKREKCRFKDAECNFCHKKGHIARICRKKNK